MRFILFLAIFIFFSSPSHATGQFFSSDWWEDDWWEEEPVIIQKPSPYPQQNMQQQRQSLESIQERLERLKKLLEEKRNRRAPPGYEQRKK